MTMSENSTLLTTPPPLDDIADFFTLAPPEYGDDCFLTGFSFNVSPRLPALEFSFYRVGYLSALIDWSLIMDLAEASVVF